MVLNRKGGSVCLQTQRGVVPLLPGALDKNQCGSFLPDTAAPQHCAADESTPTREQVPAPKVLPESATSRKKRHRDLLPGMNEDGGAPYFKASAGHRQRAFSQLVSLSACFFPPRCPQRWSDICREREMPPANVLGCGELVSRCAHVVGFKHLGPALSSLYFTPSPLQEAGLCGDVHGPAVVKLKGQRTSAAVAGCDQERPLLPMPIDMPPASGG